MNKKTKLLSITIIISTLLISGLLLLNILEGRYKVVGNRVFDTFKGMYVDSSKIDYSWYDKELEKKDTKSNSNGSILWGNGKEENKEKNNSTKTWLDDELEKID
jgi:hypothetical protein